MTQCRDQMIRKMLSSCISMEEIHPINLVDKSYLENTIIFIATRHASIMNLAPK